jgi:hypothetical protein
VKFFRWLILGATLFFLVKTFREHWQDVLAINFHTSLIQFSFLALLLTLIAHIWSGIVWAGILKFLQQPAPLTWVLPVYLQTNLAKYIPGNVWHFYGRIRAVQAAGSSLEAASLSTLLEPLLMATAAVLITLATIQTGNYFIPQNNPFYQWLPFVFASSILITIHPRLFNPVLNGLARLKKTASPENRLQIKYYPWFPLLGEMGFVALRASGFIITLAGFTSLNFSQLPLLLGVFSLSWCLGLVIPSPGGIGVFESSAIALLNQTFSPAILLSTVALFRLLSLSAEAFAAAISWGVAMRNNKTHKF